MSAWWFQKLMGLMDACVLALPLARLKMRRTQVAVRSTRLQAVDPVEAFQNDPGSTSRQSVEKRKEKEEQERRYEEEKEERRRDREKEEQRHQEKKEEQRRKEAVRDERWRISQEQEEQRRTRDEEMLRRLAGRQDVEVCERGIRLPDGTTALERTMRYSSYGLPEVPSWRTELETLKSCLAEKRRAMVVYIKKLHEIADDVDKFHRGAAIATVTGASVSAAGGVLSIVGLILAPFTLGTSLIVSAVGAGVAIAGGATKITAGVAEVKSNSTDKKNVQRVLTSCSEDLEVVFKSLEDFGHYINTVENREVQKELSRTFEDIQLDFFNSDLMGSSNSMGCIKDFVKSLIFLITSVLDDIIRAAAAGAARAGAQAAGGVAARAAGIVGAVFLPLDAYDIAKNSIHIHKGAKSELAAKIREIADRLENLITMSHQDNMLPGIENEKSTGYGAIEGHVVGKDRVCKRLEEFSHHIKNKENREVGEQLSRDFFNIDLMGSSNTMCNIKERVNSIICLITSVLDDIIRAAAAGAARAGAQAAGGAARDAGIVGALFLPLDAYDIAKNSFHLYEGAKSELAAKIREIADRLKMFITMSHQGNMLPGIENEQRYGAIEGHVVG
ncbi:uncharacterized protein [Ambystoma mexicanum]|uniref:uncharacterized protein n=1 Tax=Ambystoma mexicanum TaxID=8296 RepID=UPI0037E7F20E